MAVAISVTHGTRTAQSAAGMTSEGVPTRTFVWKGVYSELLADAANIEPGQSVDTSWFVQSWNLTQQNKMGILSVTCSAEDSSTTATETDSETHTIPLSEIWTIHAVRNDVSVMAYCGPSPGANPQREQIELWMKETDKDLAANYQFRNSDGTVTTLTNVSQLLAAKIAKGVESVIRFYPVVTRKRTFSDVPKDCLGNIGFIDTPSTTAISGTKKTKQPSTLSSVIDLYQWLKCQDDLDEQADGTWVRTEGWMGIKKTDGNNAPWDANLYGADRWGMPYTANAGGNGN